MSKTPATKKTNELSKEPEQKLGFEAGFDQQDLIIPMALIHGNIDLSEENADLKNGQIVDNLDFQPLPDEFVPLKYFLSFVRKNPEKDSDYGFDPNFEPLSTIWKSTDPNDPRVIQEHYQMRDRGEKPFADKCHNFISYFPGLDTPVVLVFKRTSFRCGSGILTQCKIKPGHIFNKKFRLETVKEKSDQGGTYYVYKTRFVGAPSDEELSNAKELFDLISSSKITVHEPEDDATEGWE